jgi:hypothetical protein
VQSTAAAATLIEIPALTEDLDALPHHDKRFLPQPQVDIDEFHRTSSNGRIAVSLKGFRHDGEDVTLDNKCLVALNWPVQK